MALTKTQIDDLLNRLPPTINIPKVQQASTSIEAIRAELLLQRAIAAAAEIVPVVKP